MDNDNGLNLHSMTSRAGFATVPVATELRILDISICCDSLTVE